MIIRSGSRRRASATLAESEARFRSIAEAAPDAIVVADARGLVISWNPAAERMFGYRRHEIAGRSLAVLMPERYRERHLRGLSRVGAGGSSRLIGRSVELEGLRKDGTTFPLELSLASWGTGHGRFFSGIIRDITERVAASDALRRGAGFVRLLQDVAVASNEAGTVEQALQVVVDRICQHTGWPVGHAYLARDDTPDLVPTSIWHLSSPERFAEFRRVTEAMPMPPGIGLPGRVRVAGAPVWMADALTDPNFPRAGLAADIGVRAGFAFPVLVGDDVAAVLEFFSPEPLEHDDQLLDVVGHIGAQLGRVVERERAQRALELREAQLSEAQAISHIGSWQWDVATNFVTWSDELYRIYGLDRGTFTASFEGFLERVHPDDRVEARAVVERALVDGRPFSFDHRTIRPDGSVRVLHARGEVILDQDGQPRRMSGTGQDVTDQRRVEETLRSAYQREREAVERMERLDEMKNAILAAVSHELRTPLTVILGFTETLTRGGFSIDAEERGAFLTKIAKNAIRLDRLLSDLLDLDRLDRGILEPRRRRTDLYELVRRVAGQCEGADVRSHLIDGTGVMAYVDAPRVERIVENLLVNAARHTPPGTRIWVRLERVRGGAEIAVEDEGPGVPADQRDAIFEPFRRAQGAALATPGVGIGLSLVARFAAMHGGRAWVEERTGGGASFRVFLPDGPRAQREPGREGTSSGVPRPNRGVKAG